MAVNSPRKKYRFRVTITSPDGKVWDSFEVQKLKLPAPKLATATHGAGGSLIETPGMQEVLSMSLEKIKDSREDTKIKDWYNTVRTKGDRTAYAKTILVEELDEDMQTVLQQHILIECFPKSYEISEFEATNPADNTTEKIEFSVREMK